MTVSSHRWLICVILAGGVFLLMMSTLGRETTFHFWGVKAMTPSFPDTRGITSGLETHAIGIDPLAQNPKDPWQRPFNYPRAWLWLSIFGIDQSHTELLGTMLIFLFFAGMALFPPKNMQGLEIGLLLFATFSPAVVLGMERGNSDLLMFLFLSVAVAGFGSGRTWAKSIGSLTLILAFVLKIYPIMGAAMILGEKKKVLFGMGLAVSLVAGIYIYATQGDIELILKATPRATGLSYGKDVLWMEIGQHSASLGVIARHASSVGLLAAAGLLIVGLTTNRTVMTPQLSDPKAIAAFRAGASVYLGTFVIGNNWDYRLVFLLLPIPFLVRLARCHDRQQAIPSLVSLVVLATILTSLWHVTIYQTAISLPYGSQGSVLLDEACNWIAFLGLSYLMGWSMPGWVKLRWRILAGQFSPKTS